jgi:hypothetical protein
MVVKHFISGSNGFLTICGHKKNTKCLENFTTATHTQKGDKSVCSNYRGISLLATASKIYAAILKDKLEIIAEEKIEEEQFGFRKGRSCVDAIFVIK